MDTMIGRALIRESGKMCPYSLENGETIFFVYNFQPLKKIILPYFQNLMRAPMIGLDISHVVNGQEVGTAVPQLT